MTAQAKRSLTISLVSIYLFFLGASGTVFVIVLLAASPLLSGLDVSPSYIMRALVMTATIVLIDRAIKSY